MYAYLGREFRQGDHVAIIGPTGSGKTHIALEIADLRTYVIGVACKPRDPLIEDARRHGYKIMGLDEMFAKDGRVQIEYVDGRPRFPRIIFWPRRRLRSLEAEKSRQEFAELDFD